MSCGVCWDPRHPVIGSKHLVTGSKHPVAISKHPATGSKILLLGLSIKHGAVSQNSLVAYIRPLAESISKFFTCHDVVETTHDTVGPTHLVA